MSLLAGKEVKLTTTEFRLLHLLASHPNKAFAREDLLDKVWGQSRHVTLRSVDTCFWRLREKLEKDTANAVYLKTVRGVGYVFSAGKGEGEGKICSEQSRTDDSPEKEKRSTWGQVSLMWPLWPTPFSGWL